MITKGGTLWACFDKLVPIDMAVCSDGSDHTDSFEQDHFDQNFHHIFGLKVNNNTVFEASIVEYVRYETPPWGIENGVHIWIKYWI